LREAGFVEDQNCAIEFRWAEGHYDHLPTLASDLVHRRVAVIVASSFPASLAAKEATAVIPIVFETAADPVKAGLVASLNRPGGNVTGVTQLNVEVESKRLELLHELLPNANALAYLYNPTDPGIAEPQMREVRSAAQAFGIKLTVLNAATEQDFEPAFAKLAESQAGGLVIGGDAFFSSHSTQLAVLTVQHRVPAIYQWRDQAV
jgi:putative ABC transport system substrate-binding protein